MNWSTGLGKCNTTHHVRGYLSRAIRDKKNGDDSCILYVWKVREKLGWTSLLSCFQVTAYMEVLLHSF